MSKLDRNSTVSVAAQGSPVAAFSIDVIRLPSGNRIIRVTVRLRGSVAVLGEWMAPTGFVTSSDFVDCCAVHHDAVWNHLMLGGGVQESLEGLEPG